LGRYLLVPSLAKNLPYFFANELVNLGFYFWSEAGLDASNDKAKMRSALRQLRKDYVTEHAAHLEDEYAKLADFAPQLARLYGLIQESFPERAVDAQASRIVVASFKPQHSEINPKYLEEALMMLGHHLVWPRVDGNHLRFFSNDDMPAFVRGSYGLLEPGHKATEAIPSVILVPLLGFDEQGMRLGQGGGYYDRTLERLNATVLAIGVAWPCQQVAAIPVEAYDFPLAGVITPSDFHRF
jgi:5-formyltetrahydrofolate cyclo-ligase